MIIINITGEISIAPKLGVIFLITLKAGSINLNKKSIIIDINEFELFITLKEINMFSIT